jgi:hypothetical protein
MTRVQVLLTEEQDRQLESLAQRLRMSKTGLVREGVDAVLHRRGTRSSDALLDLVAQAGRVGRKDVSRRHDAYVLGLVRKRRR